MTGAAIATGLAGVPDGFWRRVATSAHRLLFLDYDGTLAPFCARREEARASARVVGLLEAIASAGRTTVAIVSGRPLTDLIRFLGSLPAILIAEHGRETRRADGHVERHPVPAPSLATLESAAAIADREGWGEHVERKRGGLVLHTRDLEPERAERLLHAGRSAWGKVAARGGLRLDTIDGGLELRATDRDKGSVVRELLAVSPPGTLAVYLGDDVTDEDAFREIEPAGVGVRVGADERASRASGRLPSVGAVEIFLERWLAILRDAPVS